jgi:hypothetical protein
MEVEHSCEDEAAQARADDGHGIRHQVAFTIALEQRSIVIYWNIVPIMSRLRS